MNDPVQAPYCTSDIDEQLKCFALSLAAMGLIGIAFMAGFASAIFWWLS